MKRVGLVGVGIMGKLMLTRIQKLGYEVVASTWGDAEKEFCLEHGAIVAESKKDLAEKSDIIIVCLATTQLCKACAEELKDYITDRHIVIELSTMSPENAIELNDIYSQASASFIEGVILGRALTVGKWTIIAAGDEEKIKEIEHILLAFAEKVVPSKGIGSASTIKVLNNTMFCIFNAAICETFVTVENAGVDLKVFYETIVNSHAATNCGVFKEIGARIVEERYDSPNATVNVGIKDISCGKAVAKSTGIATTYTDATVSLFENAAAYGLGLEDTAALFKYLRHVYPKNK